MQRTLTAMVGAVLLLAPAAGALAQDEQDPVTGAEANGWSALVLPQTEAIGALATGIAVGPESMVAVGGRACERKRNDLGRCWGQPWISTDGVSWEAVEARTSGLDLGDFVYAISGPEIGLGGVAYGPGGYVAFGHADPAPERDTKRESRGIVPTLWRSDDGRTWQRVPAPEDFAPGGMMLSGPWLHAIAGSEDGYLLGGTVYGTPAPRAAIWSSPDGLTWTLAGPAEAFDVGAYIDTMEVPVAGGISAIAVAPSTAASAHEAIAVGSACPPARKGAGPRGGTWRKTFEWTTGECWAQVWRSDDGLTWDVGRLVDEAGSAIEAYWADDVASTGDRAVVGVGPAAILFSEGAQGWAVAEGARLGRQVALTASVAGFHAVVPECTKSRCRQKTLALWSSGDGASWALDASQPALPARMEDVINVDATAFADRIIVTAGYWTWPESDLASMALLSPALAAAAAPAAEASAEAGVAATADPS